MAYVFMCEYVFVERRILLPKSAIVHEGKYSLLLMFPFFYASLYESSLLAFNFCRCVYALNTATRITACL